MSNWRNRIVRQGEKPAIDFLANPLNWRIHPLFQQQAVKGVLDTIGWIQQVVESDKTGVLLDGHLRVELALSEGEQTPVPYIAVDVSPEEEALILATLDPLSALAVTDNNQLKGLLSTVESGSGSLNTLLDTMKKNAGLMNPPSRALPQGVIPQLWGVVIECENEQAQRELLDRMVREGYQCRALLS